MRRLACKGGFLAALALLACGTPNPPEPTVDVTGTWTGTLTSTDDRGTPVFGVLTVSLLLSQNGRALSGVFRSGGPAGTLAGAVSGNRVSFIVTTVDCAGQLSFTGSVREQPPAQPALDLSYEGTEACTGDEMGQGTLTLQ